MAKALGIKVWETRKWDDEMSGMVKKTGNSDSGFEMYINAEHARVRRRFTIAHEIAHVVLHPTMIGDGIVEDAMLRSHLPQRTEFQANRMAADILMPEHLVRPAFKDTSRDPTALSQLFEVSFKAMEIRLSVLGLAG